MLQATIFSVTIRFAIISTLRLMACRSTHLIIRTGNLLGDLMKKHTEIRLEDAIVDELTTKGGFVFIDYNKGPTDGKFDRANALDPEQVLSFIQTTQARMWQRLTTLHGTDTNKLLIDHLCKELEIKGTLKVLRQGFKCYGLKFRVAIFAPNNRM